MIYVNPNLRVETHKRITKGNRNDLLPVQDREHHILHQVRHREPQANHNQHLVDILEVVLASVYVILQAFDQPVASLESTLKFDLKLRTNIINICELLKYITKKMWKIKSEYYLLFHIC